MDTNKKGLFEKVFSASFKKTNDVSWKVILKGIPDKGVEENLLHILKVRLNAAPEAAQKIIESVPVVLFGDLTSHEAEQIKLRLNGTGIRTAISNDPDEYRGMEIIAWPRKVTPEDFVDLVDAVPVPPPFPAMPTVPLAHKTAGPVIPPKLPAAPPTPVMPERREMEKDEKKKLLYELEVLRSELREQLDRLEKLIQSLKTPVPPVPGLKSDSFASPRVR